MSGQSDIESSAGGTQWLDDNWKKKAPKTWSVGAQFRFEKAKSRQACKLNCKPYGESEVDMSAQGWTESVPSPRVNGKRKGWDRIEKCLYRVK